MSDRDANIATVRRAVEAVNERNFEAVQELIHPEYKRHDLYGGLPEVSGQSGAADILQLVLQAMPDVHIEIKQIFSGGDRVAAHTIVSGTHQGDLFGVPGTGQPVEVNRINLLRLVDGKIAEVWELFDVWGLMRGVGATGNRG